MRKVTESTSSLHRWERLFWITMGILVGTGAFTFYYARGFSYFSNDPRSCVNCHIMRDQFDGWNRSSHKAVASCNTCHTPKNLAGKYAVKGINGWNHSAAFTTGLFDEPIQIKTFNARVVQDNCLYCHAEMVSRMGSQDGPGGVDCIMCHGNVGHSNRNH